ncbi:MAG: hypothetical protein ACOC4C_03300 [Fibrobacterota bacterium]
MVTIYNLRGVRDFEESPVFIVANVRSGTTALLNALKRHPALVMADRDAPSIHLLGRVAFEYTATAPRQHYFVSSNALSPKSFRSQLAAFAFKTVWGNRCRYSFNILRRYAKKNIRRLGWKVTRWGVKAFPEKNDSEGLLCGSCHRPCLSTLFATVSMSSIRWASSRHSEK